MPQKGIHLKLTVNLLSTSISCNVLLTLCFIYLMIIEHFSYGPNKKDEFNIL